MLTPSELRAAKRFARGAFIGPTWPRCPECDGITDPQEFHWLWKRVCFSCGVRRMDALLSRIVARQGKRAALASLKALASAKSLFSAE